MDKNGNHIVTTSSWAIRQILYPLESVIAGFRFGRILYVIVDDGTFYDLFILKMEPLNLEVKPDF